MSDNPSISEIWTSRIYFKGKIGNNKPRPVLVVNYNDGSGLYTIQEITSVEPKTPPTYFDGFKELIRKWQESGLDEKSYVKCSPTNTHRIERIRLHGYIGVMHEDDFENIINKIVEANLQFKN